MGFPSSRHIGITRLRLVFNFYSPHSVTLGILTTVWHIGSLQATGISGSAAVSLLHN